MPYYKCTCCHHEREYIKTFKTDSNPLCDWCGAPMVLLKEKTELEESIKDIYKIVKENY